MRTNNFESKWAAVLFGVLLLTAVTAPAQDNLKPFLIVFGDPLKPTWNLPRTATQQAQVELGRLLYFEKRLSRDNSISCNSCHDTKKFGVDGKAFSVGFDKHLTGRNSPTSFNAFFARRAVLGRARAHCGGTGQRSHPRSGRNGDAFGRGGDGQAVQDQRVPGEI